MANSQASQPTQVSLYECEDLVAHHCGYCNQEGNISVGMVSELMRIEDYQLLIDRGWRRSGTYIYKPAMDRTCCPLYTIKNDALNFEPSRSQRRLVRHNRRFFERGVRRGGGAISEAAAEQQGEKAASSSKESSEADKVGCDECSRPRQGTAAQRIIEYALNEANFKDTDESALCVALKLTKIKSKHKRLFRKLKALKQSKRLAAASDVHLKRSSARAHCPHSLQALLEPAPGDVHRLELSLVRSWPPSPQFHACLAEVHALYAKYQAAVHNDSPLECNLKQFQRFLCTSPLLPLSHQGPLAAAHGYGSFHQHYRLDGKLIAVGVLDVLTTCVSSVYFFYDPDFHFLNLGTYSALHEIRLVQQLHRLDPAITDYYLGFYVHSCRKMRYKGSFKPSFLLDPEVFTWHRIEGCRHKLDVAKYCRFADASAVDADECGDVSEVMIRVKFRDAQQSRLVRFAEFCELLTPSYVPTITRLVRGYCRLFGRTLSGRVQIKF